MVTITVTSVLSLAFAPISLFFLLTAFSYSFYKILNVAILGDGRVRRPEVPHQRHARAERPHGRGRSG